ncbi:MAG: adenylosuccinate synthetase, partial [Erysipelotrichaceae bacterium]|nr:adenylosuccinate synthetase [Erysipelotrichaceae bacterium]
MHNCAVVGINWGDEGKGRMVDLLTKDYDIVIRYQGGGNAGHTVVNEYGEFALHLLPSGVFHKGIVNILGNNVAIDPENLCKEIDVLKEKGIAITPDNLKISDRASILMPWHRDLDALEEQRLKDKKFGSTKQGIAPFYSDKYQKKTLQTGELFFPERFEKRLEDLCEWKNLIISKVYGADIWTMDKLHEWCHSYLDRLAPYICDVAEYLNNAQKQDKKILFEAQLGALRDIDFGIYPFTTSSNTLASYAPIGSGCPWVKIDEVIGIVKAYSTCVGEGPFVVEMSGEEAEKLREEGKEYGAKTGRPRRVGALDLVATKYGVLIQGATELE